MGPYGVGCGSGIVGSQVISDNCAMDKARREAHYGKMHCGRDKGKGRGQSFHGKGSYGRKGGGRHRDRWPAHGSGRYGKKASPGPGSSNDHQSQDGCCSGNIGWWRSQSGLEFSNGHAESLCRHRQVGWASGATARTTCSRAAD